jgi:hypothetical protein
MDGACCCTGAATAMVGTPIPCDGLSAIGTASAICSAKGGATAGRRCTMPRALEAFPACVTSAGS